MSCSGIWFGELHDAHTRVLTPEEHEYEKRKQGVTTGIRILNVGGIATVAVVTPQSEAESAGIKPGMHLLTIDGEKVEQRVKLIEDQIGSTSSKRALEAAAYGRLLRGNPDSTVSLGLEGLNGRPLTVTLKRRLIDASAQTTSRQLQGGIVYIKMTAWESPADSQFVSALSQARIAPGLIIDLRGNGGGEAGLVFKLASLFFKDKRSLGKFISRTGHINETFSKPGKEATYEGPVVILLNEASASGSELFAGVMQEYGRATVIGRESCGCLLVIQHLTKLYGGGELSVSELDFQTPKGKRLEGDGVIPNQTVPLTRDDLLNGRDAALDKAINVLMHGNERK